jgi:hypothetical protein
MKPFCSSPRCVLPLLVALVLWEGVCDAAGQRKDPILDLRSHIEEFTGHQLIDCGHHDPPSVKPGTFFAEGPEPLQRSVACGREAASLRKPFWTFTWQHGIDSSFAEGLFGMLDGTIYRFTYDSGPCGGVGCPSRFTTFQCDDPSVTIDVKGSGMIKCQPKAPQVVSTQPFS